MLTPQDVQTQEFPKAVFGGYDMTSVDNFLETMTEDYASLYKENAILKSKLKVLVEKVEEYRSTEDSMRMALLTAQKMGDDLLEEANRKKEEILAEAEQVYQKKVEETNASIAVEEARLNAAKSATADYVNGVKALIASHVDVLSRLDEITGPVIQPAPVQEEAPAIEEPVREETSEEDKVREIEEAMRKIALEDEDVPENIDELKNVDGQELADSAIDDLSSYKKLFDDDTPTSDVSLDDALQEDKGSGDGETLKVPEEDLDATTPRPKFAFDDLQFGSNNKSGE